MDAITMLMMLHGAQITLGGRTMTFWQQHELWIVTNYINRYSSNTLYKGPDVNIAIKALKTGKSQPILEEHFNLH